MGLLLSAIFITSLILLFSYGYFRYQINSDIQKIVRMRRKKSIIITEEMLESLPDPVKKYFIYAGVVGKKIPDVVRLRQTGKIRKNEQSSWMTIQATQYYCTSNPAFVWNAYMPGKLLPLVIGRDEYIDGKGSILMKLFALFPVANQHDIQMNEASLMRYLNEMMWFPQAFFGNTITWKSIDSKSAEVTLSDRNLHVRAVLYFDEIGRLTNFSAKRYNTEAGKMEIWETPITSYGTFAGLQLPCAGKAVYRRKDGDLEYIQLTILDISYE